MSRVLVTGGAGFIGSHLVARLLREGHEVLVADNFYSGSPGNLNDFAADSRLKVLQHDITFPLFVEIDQIYHLACPASPIFYQLDPVRTTKTSVVGSINMLGLAKRTGARILLASTSEIYGDPQVHPQVERYWGHVNPIGPRSCYDEGKRCAETLFFDYHRQHGLGIKVARIFNTYGPKMRPDDGRVVPSLIIQALTNRPLTVFGDGTQTRSFCYVDDLVEGLVRLMNSSDDVVGPVNLGTPCESTMLELASLVGRLCGASRGIRFEPLPSDDPVRRRPDISLAKEVLGWEPKTNLAEGLSRTVSYFRQLPGQPHTLHSPEPSAVYDSSCSG